MKEPPLKKKQTIDNADEDLYAHRPFGNIKYNKRFLNPSFNDNDTVYNRSKSHRGYGSIAYDPNNLPIG